MLYMKYFHINIVFQMLGNGSAAAQADEGVI